MLLQLLCLYVFFPNYTDEGLDLIYKTVNYRTTRYNLEAVQLLPASPLQCRRCRNTPV